MLVSAREWHGWRRNQTIPTFQPRGELTLRLHIANEKFQARYNRKIEQAPKQAIRETTLNIALLGFGLETEVRASENRGRLLKHDFVVLDVIQKTSMNGRWSGLLPSSPLSGKATRLAVVAWATDSPNQRPLQVTGGWLTH